MNYINIYNCLVKKAKDRNFYSKRYRLGKVISDSYTETHHIIPKCMGGTNSKANLVVFTLKEHFIAHYLLCKIHPTNVRVNKAFMIMINRTPDKTANGYAKYKELYISELKVTMNSPDYWTSEKRQTHREILTKKYESLELREMIGNKVKQAYIETDLRQKVSAASKANWKRPEYIQNQKNYQAEHWKENEEGRKIVSERVKKQNLDNPELKKKRIAAISNHMYNKSEEWKLEQGLRSSEFMNLPKYKQLYSSRYSESNFDNSRKVIDIQTKQVYTSAKNAAESLNLGYEVVKKWLYKNIPKHNLKWLDVYEKENEDEQK